jgi:hypothetical protein
MWMRRMKMKMKKMRMKKTRKMMMRIRAEDEGGAVGGVAAVAVARLAKDCAPPRNSSYHRP